MHRKFETNSNRFSTLGLTKDAVALYKYAVANPGWTWEEASAGIGLDRARLYAASRTLQENLLLQRSMDPDRDWDAVGPKSALADLVMSKETQLRDTQLELLRAQEELLSLVPSYFDALQQRAQHEPVDVFHGMVTVRRLLAEQARVPIAEVCVASFGHDEDEIRWVRDLGVEIAGLPQQGKLRLLLEHSAQAHSPVRHDLDLLGQSGWDVRTTHSVPFQLILLDQAAAFLPTPDSQHGYAVTVVHHSAVVASFWAAFERLWSVASPHLAAGRPGLDIFRDQLRTDILLQLAAGRKDEVIARQLGLSVRTCRRHIAAIMEELGAAGRFQAGVLTQRLIFENGQGNNGQGSRAGTERQ